jgi:signal transduction histidine kinase
MGLRQSFVALGVAFAAIVLLLNGVVLGLAARMDEQSQDLQKTLHGDRAAFEVLNHLVEAARAQRLLNETGDDRWRTQRDTAEGQLFAWLDVADEAARSEHELRAAAELRDAVEAFHEEQLTPPSAAIPPPRIPDFSRVDAASTAYLAVIANRADVSVATARRWARAGFLLAAACSLGSLLGVWIAYRRSWRTIYLPVARLQHVLDQASTDPDVRAPREGPKEFAAISEAINALLESAASQRARQLTFLASIYHDLRNPITTLRASAELQARRAGSEEGRDRAEAFVRQVDRMNRLVEDLVDVGRVEAGAFQLELRDADLREVVTDAWRQYAESSEIHTVREEIPTKPVVVRHDPVRIAQVLGNLLGHAIKYSPGGGAVVLRPWRAPPWGVIEVEDQGIGIPQEAQPKIFEPFTRAQAHEASFPGMGLGLSVVRRLVLAHGGRLEMESQEGVGSTFRILLPLAP